MEIFASDTYLSLVSPLGQHETNKLNKDLSLMWSDLSAQMEDVLKRISMAAEI